MKHYVKRIPLLLLCLALLALAAGLVACRRDCTHADSNGDGICDICRKCVAHQWDNTGVCTVCALDKYLKFTKYSSSYTVSDYTGTATSVTIPANSLTIIIAEGKIEVK